MQQAVRVHMQRTTITCFNMVLGYSPQDRQGVSATCGCTLCLSSWVVTSYKQSFLHPAVIFILRLSHSYFTPLRDMSSRWRETPHCQLSFFITSASSSPTKREIENTHAVISNECQRNTISFGSFIDRKIKGLSKNANFAFREHTERLFFDKFRRHYKEMYMREWSRWWMGGVAY